MTIKVLYPNGIGFADSSELDSLIENRKILAFFRSNKLVVVGIHRTRNRQEEWLEQERRSGTNG